MDIDIGGKAPITLPDDIYGILGVRSWNLKDASDKLQSLFAGLGMDSFRAADGKTDHAPRRTRFLRLPPHFAARYGLFLLDFFALRPVSHRQNTGARTRRAPGQGHRAHGRRCQGRMVPHPVLLPARSLYSDPDMKRQVKESKWLKSMLARYDVPVYLTDATASGSSTRSSWSSTGAGQSSRRRSNTGRCGRAS